MTSGQRFELLGMAAVFGSPAMCAILEKVRRYAQVNAAVLIEGESGSGKEVIARAIHHFSLRSSRPWVDISCGALPEHLVESELFGYEKGAFSGADGRKNGLFELAHGGTLFLDEIGELDARLQVKLLRVLDIGEFFRLGATRKTKIDVRIVAATNQDLREAVAKGTFRKDLYHRLAQLCIGVPPLRQRREDIPLLLEMFREKYDLVPAFSPAAMDALMRYDWPGNVRELRNVAIAAAAAATREEIRWDDLPEELRAATGISMTPEIAEAAEPGGEADGDGLLGAMERNLILQVLGQTNGHHEKAARMLGISSRTLSRRLKMYNLEEQIAV